MKIYIVYQIQPCQFLILVLYSPVCACSVICKTVTSLLAFPGSHTLSRDKMEKTTRDLDCLFQDDEAVIHRTQHVLETVSRCFPHRIPPGMASHTADLLPIENIWAIIKMNVPKHGPFQSLKQLKTAIKKIWREIDADKPLLQRMMKSCCERCKACIMVDGDQVHKKDYSGF